MAGFREDLVRFRYDLSNAFLLAVDSIRAHKLRSFLTLLGVIIGVASVVLVGAAIYGLGVYAEESTAKAFGSNSFLVAQIASAGRMTPQGIRRKAAPQQADPPRGRRLPARRQRRHHALQPLPAARRRREARQRHLRGRHRHRRRRRDGAKSAISPWSTGRFFTDQEERNRAFVAVIGDEVRTTLFPAGASPVGKTVKINGLDFTVIGVLEKLGSAFGRSLDNSAYIPYTAYVRLFGPGRSIAVFVQPRAETGLPMEAALDTTRAALRVRFHARPGQPDNFDTLTPGRHPRLHRPDAGDDRRRGGAGHLHLAGGGRHRHHEHHAGERHRADARDRRSKIPRRAPFGRDAADPASKPCSWPWRAAPSASAWAPRSPRCSRASSKSTCAITPGYVVLALVVSSVVGIASGWYPAARAAQARPGGGTEGGVDA